MTGFLIGYYVPTTSLACTLHWTFTFVCVINAVGIFEVPCKLCFCSTRVMSVSKFWNVKHTSI